MIVTLPQPPTPPTLDNLGARAQAGDREAFGEVVRLLQEPLYFAILRLVEHSADARDLTQRAFLQAWTQRERLENPAALRGWIFAIGLNLARNHVRDRGARRFDPVEDLHLPAREDGADADLEALEDKERLRRYLEALPPRQREVIALRIDAELPFREIGQTLGCSEGAARVNFHHGLQRLRELMAGE